MNGRSSTLAPPQTWVPHPSPVLGRVGTTDLCSDGFSVRFLRKRPMVLAGVVSHSFAKNAKGWAASYVIIESLAGHRVKLKLPGPVTGYQHDKCYARAYKNCSTIISKEHFFSETLLCQFEYAIIPGR